MATSIPETTRETDKGPSSRVRALLIAAAVATPVIAYAGLDNLVMARLAGNHNEVAASDS